MEQYMPCPSSYVREKTHVGLNSLWLCVFLIQKPQRSEKRWSNIEQKKMNITKDKRKLEEKNLLHAYKPSEMYNIRNIYPAVIFRPASSDSFHDETFLRGKNTRRRDETSLLTLAVGGRASNDNGRFRWTEIVTFDECNYRRYFRGSYLVICTDNGRSVKWTLGEEKDALMSWCPFMLIKDRRPLQQTCDFTLWLCHQIAGLHWPSGFAESCKAVPFSQSNKNSL